ncbi:MAG TPA: hypothetical protein DCG69_02285 [Bacteroidales bacterium]|nr:hypothetical protein [Bacteroidales bacterium]
MNLRYTLLSIILLILAFGFVLLPKKDFSKDLAAEDMLLAVLDDSRFLSTDEVANMILNRDPSLLLIDVRKADQFSEFNLRGAVNLPLDSLLTEGADMYLSQTAKTKVFYSNGSIYSSQAWLLSKRKGYKNVFIMRGGLNQWIETIMQPTEPKPGEPQTAFQTYEARKGASQFFGGGSADASSSAAGASKSGSPTPKKGKKKGAAGGC